MTTDRLSHAIQAGLSLPEDDRILLLGAPGDLPAGDLPEGRFDVVQGFRPDYDAWERRGVHVSLEPGEDYAAAVVFLPRARERAESRIAQACAAAPGGLVAVDGAKTDGIEAILRAVKARAKVLGTVSKAHGKVFWFVASEDFADWNHAPGPNAHGDWTAPGIFSADGPDPGTGALLAALPAKLGATVADLGAGWGGLARGVLERDTVAKLHLVEADHAALDCARRNIDDPRAEFHWEDATQWQPPAALDGIVMNPPFHQGRRADPDIGKAFITHAARILKPTGSLWLVANRHLPYEMLLQERFRLVDEIAGDSRYKVLNASRPRR